ncbi:MAG: hypothetical protein BWK79_04430 [Beggiatoa sp. IS2]|nr:MAG: hypothetical protein BWK79_04430 [Beggiatoa sp. IS2]
MLDNIHIVLVGITHPGNIGAAARAMKTMGIMNLTLVQPRQFPCVEATVRAAGADDVLANAHVYDTFEESLQECTLVFGTSARQRSIPWPIMTPKACAQLAVATPTKVAIVFGREQTGLTNRELSCCHYLVQIPTHPLFTSLNIAAAVQIMTYELFSEYSAVNPLSVINQPPSLSDDGSLRVEHYPVPSESMEQFYQHLEQTLIELSFLNPQKPKRLLRRLRRLFNRTQPDAAEMNILRGILTAAQICCRKSKD